MPDEELIEQVINDLKDEKENLEMIPLAYDKDNSQKKHDRDKKIAKEDEDVKHKIKIDYKNQKNEKG